MRFSLTFLATTFAALFMTAILRAAPLQTDALELRVMTFNLRFASNTPPNAWPDRRPVMKHAIEQAAPDVFGTQEGLYSQLRDMAADLPAYEWIGLGRAGGSHDEFAAIFFKRDRFEPLEYDHFWLSDTPNVVGSITWGPRFRRMVTWVRLQDRKTRRVFMIWNTHFDHEVETARQKSAELICSRIQAAGSGAPVILVGDFNCPAGTSRAFQILTQNTGFNDAWQTAEQRVGGDLNTFHDYKEPLHHGERIDWILVPNGTAVKRAEIFTFHEGTQYPSDHFPVFCDIRLP
ncbi:MAG TPA: endonuclease/exonuclease/phosphatase family protein [Opitutaceae bacterium]|nr:endonuclease/exonuclease/phosphatase family protein [Opitutaceae bacterium]